MKKALTHPLTAVAALVLLAVGYHQYMAAEYKNSGSDMTETSVMITNREKTSGGSGVILKSENDETQILTNAHVCRVVKNGGLAITTRGDFQVKSYKASEVSDLCMVFIGSNLKMNTNVATNDPIHFDHSYAVGHPALYPTVVSEGHFSGKQIIKVMTELRACTEDDYRSPDAILCVFLGGIPVVKSYESELISSTIMPGSSGSGVFNRKGELVGLVFAGQGGFGYGWTVPHDQLLTFLNKEVDKLQKTVINQVIEQKTNEDDNKRRAMIKEKCRRVPVDDDRIKDICEIINRDVIMEDAKGFVK